ncbi:MAG: ABC transporter permease [Bacteroidales bacterium]|nr:ABC transporter permease [Bacteroidales bacterium]
MKRFFQIIYREIRLLSTNLIMLGMLFGAPIVYSVLIGFVYKDAKVNDLPVVVIDEDNSPLSHAIIDGLDDNEYMKVADVRFQMTNMQLEVATENYHAVVIIPQGFEADINQNRHPEIRVDVNSANMLTANYVSTGVMQVLGTFNAGIEIKGLQKHGLPADVAAKSYEAFHLKVTRFFNPSSNYLYFLLPGMLGTIMQQVFLMVVALSFARECENRSFPDLFKFSKSPLVLLLGKAIPYWVLGMLVWLPLIRLTFGYFHIPMFENMGAYWLISGLFVLSLTFAGIAVSVLLRTQLQATEVLMVLAAPGFIISGQTWPLQQMPEWVQSLAAVIPLTHYTEAFRKLLMIDLNISQLHAQIMPLLYITAISFVFAWIVLHFRVRLAKKRIAACEKD